MKKRYSGDASKKFWDAVNSLSGEERASLYTAGVMLQNMETYVLGLLDAASPAGRTYDDGSPIHGPGYVPHTKTTCASCHYCCSKHAADCGRAR